MFLVSVAAPFPIRALAKRHGKTGPYVVVIDTDPYPSTPHGGHWWDVAVPEVGDHDTLRAAYARYIANAANARLTN